MAILADIYRRVQVSPAESLILQTLAQYANVFGQNARMSYEALGKATGFSLRWVITLVKRLEARCLLRVTRRWIGPKRCAINVYQIIRPWLREMSYHEAYMQKQAAQLRTAQTFSERGDQRHPPQGEKKSETRPERFILTHEECIKMGLTEGSLAYRASRGLPDNDPPQENPQTEG